MYSSYFCRSEIFEPVGGTGYGSFETPDILSGSEFKPFWISWYALLLKFGTGKTVGGNELTSYSMQNVPSVSGISVACSSTNGAEWLFKPVASVQSKD